MSLIRNNFTPIGGSARSGNAPAMFSYSSPDAKTVIVANGYFNPDGSNNLIGVVQTNDILEIVGNNDVQGLITYSKHFVVGDGKGPGADGLTLNAPGGSYAIGDILKLTYTDGSVLRDTLIEVLTLATTAVATARIMDPGLFDKDNIPTSLGPLATTTVTGSGSGATFTVTTITNTPDITLSDLEVNAT